MDKSKGYENIALKFLKTREDPSNKIGVSTVKKWAGSLPVAATILDLGCGSGIPISKTLIDQNCMVYGIDASPTLSAKFKKNFPNHEIRCEAVEASTFYGAQFDGIISWGLIFLLSPAQQIVLLEKMARHLKTGGKLLFTSPYQKVKWLDVMTGLPSESLGAKKYTELLAKNGILLVEEYTDAGENQYYSCIKIQ